MGAIENSGGIGTLDRHQLHCDLGEAFMRHIPPGLHVVPPLPGNQCRFLGRASQGGLIAQGIDLGRKEFIS